MMSDPLTLFTMGLTFVSFAGQFLISRLSGQTNSTMLASASQLTRNKQTATKADLNNFPVIYGKQNLGVYCARQSGHINSSNYTWTDSLGTSIIEEEFKWKLIKNTFGLRYTFVWKIPIGKKGDLGYTILKKLHVSRTNGFVYSGLSANYSIYENIISTSNPNFNNNNFKLRSFDGQIILLGVTGFRPHSGLGFNMECAVGGPYFIKAGLVFAL